MNGALYHIIFIGVILSSYDVAVVALIGGNEEVLIVQSAESKKTILQAGFLNNRSILL